MNENTILTTFLLYVCVEKRNSAPKGINVLGHFEKKTH
jgi:hypothetical protein